MNRIDCRNVRQQIEELRSHTDLGRSARNHVDDCAACAAFERDEHKLQEMVESLRGIEAPADFDFKLRARLASVSGATKSFTFANLFSTGQVAFATLVLLFGVVLGLVMLRNRAISPLNSGQPAAEQVHAVTPPIVQPETVSNAVVDTSDRQPVANTEVAGNQRIRGNVRPQFLARNGRIRSTDSSVNAARLVRPEVATGSMVFPLATSYQPMKLSVDDGRGSSRTISLPRVSFGSSRALAQNPTPIMASMRDSW